MGGRFGHGGLRAHRRLRCTCSAGSGNGLPPGDGKAPREEPRHGRSFSCGEPQLLEEEVRRIFGYFDRTMEEIQAADPDGSQDLLRAIRGERDRRLTETLERFDPKARASLCAIRAIQTPIARVRLRFLGGAPIEGTLDAW